MTEFAQVPNRRIPRSASILRSQVLAEFPDAGTGEVGEQDGFGVVRSIWFDGDAAKMLLAALPHLGDERVASFEKAEKGRVLINFATTTVSDQVATFPLVDAALIGNTDFAGVIGADDVSRLQGEVIEKAAAEVEAKEAAKRKAAKEKPPAK